MADKQIIIPTMHLSSTQLNDPREQIIYVLRQFTSIPSGVTDVYVNEVISMQYIRAESGHDANVCANKVSMALLSVIERILPDYEVSVDVTPKFLDKIRYNIVVDILATKDGDIVEYTSLIDITDDNQITFSPYQGE